MTGRPRAGGASAAEFKEMGRRASQWRAPRCFPFHDLLGPSHSVAWPDRDPRRYLPSLQQVNGKDPVCEPAAGSSHLNGAIRPRRCLSSSVMMLRRGVSAALSSGGLGRWMRLLNILATGESENCSSVNGREICWCTGSLRRQRTHRDIMARSRFTLVNARSKEHADHLQIAIFCGE